ncbi:MAG: type 11 methyltransferase [Armatimonadetes bacterium]|nr:type 11 methyltransferase [Armatimonadota bacterium]
MNPEEYARMHALEDWYWWFVARRDAAARMLLDHAPPERPLRILDAGCGTGGMMDLYRTWPDPEVTGDDFSPDALRFSHGRGHHRLVGGDLTLLPFRTGSFDVVSALDVIEHVEQDARAVSEIARVLRPGGILVATVPAYQFLWGPHDEALHHMRRYTAGQFNRVIHDSGLRVEKSTYLLTALFPLAAAARLLGRKRKPEDAAAALPKVPPAVNRALIGFQAAELQLARLAPLPFGLTVMAVARKPVPARLPLSSVEEGVPALARR